MKTQGTLTVHTGLDNLTLSHPLKDKARTLAVSNSIQLHLASLFIFIVLPSHVRADAIVVPQAMFASTNVEYFFVRPADIQRRYDLGLEGVETITPQMQDDVKQGIVQYLEQFFPLTIDGAWKLTGLDILEEARL